MLSRLLFPLKPNDDKSAMLLLLARVIFATFLMTHGLQKLTHFSELSGTFPDPIGLGSRISVMLAVFAEFFCSLGVIFGFLTRLALIPMMFTMSMASFVIHNGDKFSDKELPLVYLIIFLLLFLSGPGKYSIDYWIGKKINRR